jgi:hypothetical protein
MSDRQPFWIAVGDIHERPENIGRIPFVKDAAGLIISGDITNAGGQARAEQVLRPFWEANPNLLAQIGNMDHQEVSKFLEEKGWNIHARGLELDEDLGLMGVGYSNWTPFGTPCEVDEGQLQAWLEAAYADVRDLAQLVVVCHTPPKDTATDRVKDGAHVGSPVVREFLERVQPELCITGHIHEAVAEDHLGRTKVINPGMLDKGGYVSIRRTASGLEASLKRLEA